MASRRSSVCLQCLRRLRAASTSSRRSYASAATATATVPAPDPIEQTFSPPPLLRYPLTQPPSHKPPEFRKSQLHRQYTSLIRSTPLFLLFQHSNLTSGEWMALRRELSHALDSLSPAPETPSSNPADLSPSDLSAAIKMQVIQGGIFASALQVAEYFHPSSSASPSPSDSSTTGSTIPNAPPTPSFPHFTHFLSRTAHDAVKSYRGQHPLSPLLVGPLALLTFPSISPTHLAASLSILSPNKRAGFAPPTRRKRPAYWEPNVQSAVGKLMLLGAKVSGRGVVDHEGVLELAKLPDMDGLRAQIAGMLDMARGAALVDALDTPGRSLYVTLEGRRMMLDAPTKEGAKADVNTGEAEAAAP